MSAIIATGLICGGCDQLRIMFGRAPSLKVFDECLQEGKKSGILADATLKQYCVDKYQGEISDQDIVDGKSNPTGCLPETQIEWRSKRTGQILKDDYSLGQELVFHGSDSVESSVLNKDEPRKCDGYEGTINNKSGEGVKMTDKPLDEWTYKELIRKERS
jgi:hypothetical protein